MNLSSLSLNRTIYWIHHSRNTIRNRIFMKQIASNNLLNARFSTAIKTIKYGLITLIMILVATSTDVLLAQSGPWTTSIGQEERPHFTEKFDPSEFAERRNKVYDAIGVDAFAVVQGAPMPLGFQAFRQNNEFYYLSGIVSPYAYWCWMDLLAPLQFTCRTEMNAANTMKESYCLQRTLIM